MFKKLFIKVKHLISVYTTPYTRITWPVSGKDHRGQTNVRRYYTKHYVFGIRVAFINEPVQVVHKG